MKSGINYGIRAALSLLSCVLMLAGGIPRITSVQAETTSGSFEPSHQQHSCGVGEGPEVPLEVTQAFLKAFERNGGAARMGMPENCVHPWWEPWGIMEWVQDFPEMPDWGNSVILWNETQGKAYVTRGWILDRYIDTWDDAGHNGPGSWLGAPVSDETIAPADLVSLDRGPTGEYPWVYGGEPISYFERGFISRRRGESGFRAYTYHPAVCDVSVDVTDVGDGQPLIEVSAYIDRAPGWPNADQNSDPLDAYFTVVFPNGEKRWVAFTQEDKHHFSVVVPADQWDGLLLNMGDTIHLYLDAYNRRGQDEGWAPRLRTYPKGVAYQPGWPTWEWWEGPLDAVLSMTLNDGTGGRLPNDNWQCPGNEGSEPPPVGIKVPPTADAGPNRVLHVGEALSLDGSGSYDPDGGTLSYEWQVMGTPPGQEVRLGETLYGATPSWREMTPDDILGWTFRLIVTDDEGSSAEDTVIITVRYDDRDRDGISNHDESQGWRNAQGEFTTDPNDPDTDDGGLADGGEMAFNTVPYTATDDLVVQIVNGISANQLSQILGVLTGNVEVPGYPGVCIRSRGRDGYFPEPYGHGCFHPDIPCLYYTWKYYKNYRADGGISQARDYLLEYFINELDFTSISLLPIIDCDDCFNLEVRLPRSGVSSPSLYLLVAHYDSTALSDECLIRPTIYLPFAKRQDAPGANDNASGVAAVMMAANVLRNLDFENEIRLVLFDAEEEGKLGSQAYVSYLKANGDWDRIAGVINLDTIGYGMSTFPNIRLRCVSEPEDWEFTNQFRETRYYTPVSMYHFLATEVITEGGCQNSDQQYFSEGGKPALQIRDKQDGPPLHTPLDTKDNISLPYYTAVTRAAIGTLAYLANPIGMAASNLHMPSPQQDEMAMNALHLRNSGEGGCSEVGDWNHPAAAYQVAASQAVSIGGFADSTVDLDMNGLGDNLRISASVTTTLPATHTVQATICSTDGATLSHSGLRSWISDTKRIDIDFLGQDLYQQYFEGQISFCDITIWNEEALDDPLHQYNVYTTTQVYHWSAFEPSAFRLGLTFAEETVDQDGDGYQDRLIVTVPVDVSEGGTFDYVAYLNTQGGTIIGFDEHQVSLPMGDNPVEINFDGASIYQSGQDGPYTVELIVTNDEGLQINSSYETLGYSYAEYEPPDVHVEEAFTDYGIDTDGNGRYNFLAIEAQTQVVEPGNYTFSGYLTNSLDEAAPWYMKSIYLAPGQNTFTFYFDGISIGEKGIDGPYSLHIVNVFNADSGEVVEQQYDAYTTTAYLVSDFENALPSSCAPDLDELLTIFRHHKVSALAIDRDDYWFGTRADGIVHYEACTGATEIYTTGNSALLHDVINDIAIAPNGDVWAATNLGASEFDGTTWYDYTEADGLVDEHINGIAISRSGLVWFGTNHGLSKYDGSTWVSYTKADGLPHNHIKALAVQAEEMLWVVTTSGIVSRYDDANWEIVEGLPSSNVDTLSVTDGGVIWFGTNKGLAAYEDDIFVAIGPEEVNINEVTGDNVGHLWSISESGGVGIYLIESGDWLIPLPQSTGEAREITAGNVTVRAHLRYVRVKATDAGEKNASQPGRPSGKTLVANCEIGLTDLSGVPIAVGQGVEINLTFTLSPGVKSTEVYYFDPDSNIWEKLHAIHRTGNSITVRTNHLSQYAVFGEISQSQLYLPMVLRQQ